MRHKNDFVMPPKTRISQENGDYYAIMPCMYEEENIAMTKMIGRHLLKDKEVRSTMMSDMMLYEADTGVLKALIDGEYITTLRTGAAAAHAALMYGKDGFTTIGLIGLGNIMTVCISLLVSRLQERKLVLKLYKHNGQENRLIDRLKSFENIQFVLCDTYEETIKGSEVVISAVTRTVDNFCSDECLKYGIEPMVTIFHWDLPQALVDLYGGWESPEIIQDYVTYAKTLFENFGDKVKYWITLNEQNIFTSLGWLTAQHPPGKFDDQKTFYQVNHYAFMAHARAVLAYREMGGKGEIGASFAYVPSYALDCKPVNAMAKRDYDELKNFWYMEQSRWEMLP